MKNIFLKSTLSLAITIACGLSPALVNAADTNPYQDGTLINPSIPVTGDTKSANGSNTATGQTNVIAGTVGNTAQNGSGTSAAANSNTAPPIDGSSDCPIVVTRNSAQVDEINAILRTTPNLDEIFNAADKASAGCFAASREMINLAIDVPQINGSLIAAGIEKAVRAAIEKQKAKILKQACEIADKALLKTLEPIHRYVTDLNQQIKENAAKLGDIGVDVEYEKYNPIEMTFNNQIQGLNKQLTDKGIAMENIGKAIDMQFNQPAVTPSVDSSFTPPATQENQPAATQPTTTTPSTTTGASWLPSGGSSSVSSLSGTDTKTNTTSNGFAATPSTPVTQTTTTQSSSNPYK